MTRLACLGATGYPLLPSPIATDTARGGQDEREPVSTLTKCAHSRLYRSGVPADLARCRSPSGKLTAADARDRGGG
jgi:hypothetical protein